MNLQKSPYLSLVEDVPERVLADMDKCDHHNTIRLSTGAYRCEDCHFFSVSQTRQEWDRQETLDKMVAEIRLRTEAREQAKVEDNPPQPIGFLSGLEMGEPEPMVSIVGDILYRGDAGFLVAPMATGKTYLALWLAHALLTGEHDFIGYSVVQQKRPVFFLQQDQGRDSFIARTVKLGLYDRPDFRFAVRPSRTYDASVKEHSARLAEELVAANAGVLIVDAWSDVISENESDNTVAAAAFGSLKGLRESANLDAILVLAHPRKDGGGGVRGAGAPPAAADFIWTYEGEGKATPRVFKNTKPRHSEISSRTVKWDEATGSLSVVEAPTHMPETRDSGEIVLRRKAKAILLRDPEITAKDFRSELGIRDTVSSKLYHETRADLYGGEGSV